MCVVEQVYRCTAVSVCMCTFEQCNRHDGAQVYWYSGVEVHIGTYMQVQKCTCIQVCRCTGVLGCMFTAHVYSSVGAQYASVEVQGVTCMLVHR